MKFPEFQCSTSSQVNGVSYKLFNTILIFNIGQKFPIPTILTNVEWGECTKYDVRNWSDRKSLLCTNGSNEIGTNSKNIKSPISLIYSVTYIISEGLQQCVYNKSFVLKYYLILRYRRFSAFAGAVGVPRHIFGDFISSEGIRGTKLRNISFKKTPINYNIFDIISVGNNKSFNDIYYLIPVHVHWIYSYTPVPFSFRLSLN